jgi:flagellin-like protein
MVKKLFKKGISPLVVTIILIAFAVSLGGFVTSLGGVYYEKLRLQDSNCYEILINAFELEGQKQCSDYESKLIVNFYSVNETIRTPTCYNLTSPLPPNQIT